MKPSRKAKERAPAPGRGYLDGQMLIAMPAMNDERFARAVIYVCAHSTEGAMGIVVNHPAANIKFPDLLVQLEVIPAVERIQLPPGGATAFGSGLRRANRSVVSNRPVMIEAEWESHAQSHDMTHPANPVTTTSSTAGGPASQTGMFQ